jgi:hypothetical protein
MGIIAATFLSVTITLLGSAALMIGSLPFALGEGKSHHGADVGILSSPSQFTSGPLA